jgi:hypothetical protein
MSRLRPLPSAQHLHARTSVKRGVSVATLCLLLCAQWISQTSVITAAIAASKPPIAAAHFTLQQFLAEQPNARQSRFWVAARPKRQLEC